jgi:hypothetical protein
MARTNQAAPQAMTTGGFAQATNTKAMQVFFLDSRATWRQLWMTVRRMLDGQQLEALAPICRWTSG